MIASLVMSALLADDGLTAREIAAVLGVRAAVLRPALHELVDAGLVVTSGLTSGTRYCLAADERVDLGHVGPLVLALGECRANRREVPAVGGPRRTPGQSVGLPATLDLMGALTEMGALVLAGSDLAAMRKISLDRRQSAVAG